MNCVRKHLSAIKGGAGGCRSSGQDGDPGDLRVLGEAITILVSRGLGVSLVPDWLRLCHWRDL